MTRGGVRTSLGFVLEALRSIEHRPFVLKGRLNKQHLTVKSLHVAKTSGIDIGRPKPALVSQRALSTPLPSAGRAETRGLGVT